MHGRDCGRDRSGEKSNPRRSDHVLRKLCDQLLWRSGRVVLAMETAKAKIARLENAYTWLNRRNQELTKERDELLQAMEAHWAALLDLIIGRDPRRGLVEFIARRMTRGARP